MTTFKQLAQDYLKVEEAIKFIENNRGAQPSLNDVADSVGLSTSHFQRLFSRWVGISPKRFLQYLTKEYAKQLLEGSTNILDATFEAGLSSPGRLHDLFISCEAVTPGQYRDRGAGTEIAYGIHASPFGDCLLGKTARGICWLTFVRDRSEKELIHTMQGFWKNATIIPDTAGTAALIHQIFHFSENENPAALHLYVQGTNFQIKVWEALLKIPLGRAVTYEDIARHIGMPKAARAVGNAVGHNPIPFLIPCHRVIRKTGVFGYYGGGPARKKAMLGWEAAVQNRVR